ncbi:hypothetical protein CHS0354_035557 [Potamilus streckersoni]|uniref:Uncharacterized protein n=1 Tax=Potamilus streckersoni TaxID=2493646 RepID=A0AAE0VIJ5_9BIVA|nr:hypothetical protein CHS0354_035557 [Potamilus streckersoni]
MYILKIIAFRKLKSGQNPAENITHMGTSLSTLVGIFTHLSVLLPPIEEEIHFSSLSVSLPLIVVDMHHSYSDIQLSTTEDEMHCRYLSILLPLREEMSLLKEWCCLPSTRKSTPITPPEAGSMALFSSEGVWILSSQQSLYCCSCTSIASPLDGNNFERNDAFLLPGQTEILVTPRQMPFLQFTSTLLKYRVSAELLDTISTSNLKDLVMPTH